MVVCCKVPSDKFITLFYLIFELFVCNIRNIRAFNLEDIVKSTPKWRWSQYLHSGNAGHRRKHHGKLNDTPSCVSIQKQIL
jgi:hypothetical protein